MVQTGNKLLKKEIIILTANTKNLTNKTQSTEILLEIVQSESNLFKESFSTLEKE